MEKIWLDSYPSDVPAEIDYGETGTLVDLFEHSSREYGDRPAFHNMGAQLSYHRLEQLSRHFAAYLQQDLLLKPGDRVALMMPNLLQYPVALFGALRAGMVVVNVNPLYTPRELRHQLHDSGARIIVILENFAHILAEVIADTGLEKVIVTGVGDMLGPLKGTWINLAVRYLKRMVPGYRLEQSVSLKTVLNKGQLLEYRRPAIQSGDLAFLQYTGGTTGRAKGAMLSHRNMVANVMQAHAAYGPVLEPGKEVVVSALPLYHAFALTVNCLLFVHLGGSNLLITNPRDIAGFIGELRRNRFTVMTGVNTLFNALVNHPRFPELDFSALKLSVGGGMAIQLAVAAKWQVVTGTRLLEGYGLTECSPLVTVCPYTLEGYNGSIGLPLPSTEVRITDENGRPQAIGETGELEVRGPQVMQGYWHDDQESAAMFHGGWLATGDIAKMDAHGYLFLVDRKKDVILVSGFNVFPNEVEETVALHDKVMEVAAIGVPHEISGEVVKIFVVRKDRSLTEQELINHCRQYLTAYKVPKQVEFREELPKSNVGKILRRQLREITG